MRHIGSIVVCMKFTLAPALVTLSLSGAVFAQTAESSTPTTDDGNPSSPVSAATPAASTQAPAPATGTYVADGGTLFWVTGETRTSVDLSVPVVTATFHDEKLYVTHGNTAVSVYSCANPTTPTLLQTFTTGRGVAAGVEVVGARAWVVTVSKQAVPLDELAPAGGVAPGSLSGPQVVSPPSGAAAPNGAKPMANHAVKLVEPGTIEVAVGSRQQVRIGDRFAIYRETAVGNPDGAFKGEELVAVAEVIAVRDDSSLAELSRAAVVTNSDVARPAQKDQVESNVYPVRVPHVGEFGGTLRPIVNAGSPLGVGALAELYGSYWGKGYFVSLMLQPLGLGWTDEGNVISTSALIEGGYDTRPFSVGLGVGVSAINGDTDAMLRYGGWASSDATNEGGAPQVTDKQETHSAFTLSQWVRLGARDGLNLSLRNLLLLHKDADTDQNGFIYGGTMGKLTLPLDRRNDLFLEGGGGVMGYWLVGAGVSTWLVGNGSPGSWKLSISAGAAGIWGTKETTTTTDTYTYVSQDDVEVAGPMVAFGVTRRFGF